MLVSCDKNEERVETNQQNGDTEAVTVYICTGPKSKRYHNDNSCRGLNRCSGSVVQISLNEATAKGRTSCNICF